MREFDAVQKEIKRLLGQIPDTERKKLAETLERLESRIHLLEHNYNRAIRDRAAVHSLLNKSSNELIERYQTIFEFSGTAMAVIEEDGTISLVNTHFERLFGFSREEVEWKKKFPEFLDESVKEYIVGFHRRRLSGDETVPHYYEAKIITRNGSTREVSFSVGLFPGTGRIITSILDIEERKRAEKAVETAQKKIAILNSITRHDIHNQLTPLYLQIDMALMHTQDPVLRESLQKIERIGQNIQEQIEFMKLYQDVGVKSPIWQRVADVIRTATAGIPLDGISQEIDVGELEIYADPLLQKVFYNLVENAIRHGGKLTHIGFSVEEDPNGVAIICVDNGTGVPAKEKEHIFERTFFKHTGFGLFLSREILSITGIGIRETGVPGEGARFEILVPRGMFRVTLPNTLIERAP